MNTSGQHLAIIGTIATIHGPAILKFKNSPVIPLDAGFSIKNEVDEQGLRSPVSTRSKSQNKPSKADRRQSFGVACACMNSLTLSHFGKHLHY